MAGWATMLFQQRFWEPIAAGEVTVAFRRWKRPAAKVGSRHRVPVGVIEIDAVDVVDEAAITRSQARKAGFDTADEVLEASRGRDGDLYRITFHFAGQDPRIALRENDALSDDDLAEIAKRLDGYDARSRRGAWTRDTLAVIAARPGVRAGDLAADAGVETRVFKADVRKLKELGLTESLEVGYRLSPRGEVFLRRSG